MKRTAAAHRRWTGQSRRWRRGARHAAWRRLGRSTTASKPVSRGEEAYYDYHVPWIKDDVNAKLKTMQDEDVAQLFDSIVPGTLPRINASVFHTNKMPDLRGLKDQKYLDATATHRNRGPEDIARYAAMVAYADTGSFGRL